MSIISVLKWLETKFFKNMNIFLFFIIFIIYHTIFKFLKKIFLQYKINL